MNTNSDIEPILEVTKEHKEREEKQAELLTFTGKPQTCCVSLIDIVNSTKTTSGIPEDKLGIFYSVFLNFISNIIKKHGGIVVKNIGDSLLYYFADYKEEHNSIIDSCYCNLDIIDKRHDLNKILEEEGLPNISYRVSSDYGKVLVAVSILSSINDIFGPTVNMCAKINHIGNANKFFVGNDLYLNAKKNHEFKFEEIVDNQLTILKNSYPIYYVKK